MRPDGSDERLLTTSYLDEGPTWAPNGRVIMFEPQGRGNRPARLLTIDITGYNQREVPTPTDASDPDWSPLAAVSRMIASSVVARHRRPGAWCADGRYLRQAGLTAATAAGHAMMRGALMVAGRLLLGRLRPSARAAGGDRGAAGAGGAGIGPPALERAGTELAGKCAARAASRTSRSTSATASSSPSTARRSTTRPARPWSSRPPGCSSSRP